MANRSAKSAVNGLARRAEAHLSEGGYAQGVALAAAQDGAAPQWIQLFAGGEAKPRDGRAAWKLSNPAAVIAASKLPAPIDYDHGTARAVNEGQDSRAAGWIEELAVHGPNNEPGLWARVEWTEAGAKAVASKEYRFISPMFLHDKNSREVTRVLGAGLVNMPALDLPALASAQLEEENSVDLISKLRAALSLPDTASEDDVVQAVTAMRTSGSAMCAAGGFATLGDTEVTAICAKLKAPDQQKTIDELNIQVATLSAQLKGGTASVEVEKAITAGKLTPAQKEWAIGYASRDPEGFATFIAKAPVVVTAGRTVETAGGASAGALTDEERAVCAMLGVTEDKFKAEKARKPN